LQGMSCNLRWVATSGAAASHERYRFKLGAHTGQLGLDSLAVAALLRERRADLLPRELRYVLLAEALHPLADALEKLLHLRFEWDASAAAPDAAGEGSAGGEAACFFVDTPKRRAEFSGFVQFDDPSALATLLPALKVPERSAAMVLDWLRIPLSFRLGSTHLSLREISSISPGDIVSIEEWRSAGAGLIVSAEVGGAAGRELVGLAEGSRITLQHLKDKAMNRDIPAPASISDDNDAAGLPLDRLDALEVALRFEVGELSLSLGELKSIRAGHVFDLAQPLNRSTVRILAHGNVLGKGHLVAVGDRLGVRVAEFAPSEI
jgi:type III secretion protein Q